MFMRNFNVCLEHLKSFYVLQFYSQIQKPSHFHFCNFVLYFCNLFYFSVAITTLSANIAIGSGRISLSDTSICSNGYNGYKQMSTSLYYVKFLFG